MELYILKSAACLLIFFVFYKLVLENTSNHTLKRFYLLGMTIASFVIPFITFTSYVEVSPTIISTSNAATVTYITSEVNASVNYLPLILWSIYFIGVAFFSFKFIKNITELIQKIRKNPILRNRNIIQVLLSENVIPHTFLSYIFLNKEKHENNEIPASVILHEETHALQKHSLDILFIEVLRIVFWFNPLFWFLKRSIKLNHEFLADRAVLENGAERIEYQKTLLAFSSPDSYREQLTPSLANSINYSSIKKRFKIMKTHTSQKAILLRSLLLLPLLAVLVYGFSNKEVFEKAQQNQSNIIPLKISENSEVQTEYEKWYQIHINSAKQNATPEEVAEYNKLAKKYNKVAIENRIIKLKDLQILENIYKKMSQLQKNNSEPFPECLPTPKPTNSSKTMATSNFNNNEASEMTARNIDIIILEDGKYNINGIQATKATLLKTVERFHRDINPPIRNKILNLHITSSNVIPNKEIEFIYETLKDYGFYRLVTPNQEVVKGKGNAPLKIDETNNPNEAFENSTFFIVAQAPPPPNTNKVEYIKELGKKGATFYIGPHKYNTEEAIKMVEKSTNDVTIDVSKYPFVNLGGC